MPNLLFVVGCVDLAGDPPSPAGWNVELGFPDQQIPLVDLGIEDRDAWLSGRPRAVLDVGFAALAVRFEPDPDPSLVRLEGLFESGDQQVWLQSGDPEGTSGLDHDVSWTVRLEADDQQLADAWIAADLTGDPGCGGDRQPRSVAVFDADRRPLDWDGETVTVGGVSVAFVIPIHECMVAE